MQSSAVLRITRIYDRKGVAKRPLDPSSDHSQARLLAGFRFSGHAILFRSRDTQAGISTQCREALAAMSERRSPRDVAVTREV